MDFPENEASGFDREAADQLYQLLMDLYTNGSSEICIDPATLLSTDVDAITARNRSAALEKEAREILKVFTNAPITPVFGDVGPALNNPNERALVPRNNTYIMKQKDHYKIDIWKENQLIRSIENEHAINVLMHFINIKIDKSGGFVVTGLENVTDEIKEIIQELSRMIAMEDSENSTNDENSGVEIREITDDNEQTIEVPFYEGILKFSANQNPVDVLSEIYCTEVTSDNKKIFKIPELGNIVVSPDDDPIKVFKTITGYDISDFYKNRVLDKSKKTIISDGSDNTVEESPEKATAEIPENSDEASAENPDNSHKATAEIPDHSENKENEAKVKNTKCHRRKKNKQKRKSKKRK